MTWDNCHIYPGLVMQARQALLMPKKDKYFYGIQDKPDKHFKST